MGCPRLRIGQIFNDAPPETEPSSLILTEASELAEETGNSSEKNRRLPAGNYTPEPPNSYSCHLQVSPVSRVADLPTF